MFERFKFNSFSQRINKIDQFCVLPKKLFEINLAPVEKALFSQCADYLI